MNGQFSPEEIRTRLKAVLVQTFHLSIDEVESVNQIGSHPKWDSIGHMDLVVAIEDEFKISFATHEIADLTTIKSIEAAIAGKEVKT